MADPQFQLDQPPSFEIPKAGGVNVQPASLPNPAAGGAGYIGKPGQVAAIAASALEGWMQGTRLKEQREREKARMSLDGARYGYAQSIEALRNWRMENNNPDQYKDAQTGQSGRDAWNQKYKLLVADAQNSQKLYANMMEGYVTKDEPKAKGAGGKLKAVGERVKKGLTAQSPQLFPQKLVDFFGNQNVENLSAPDPVRAAQYRAATTEEKATQEQVKAQEAQNKLQTKLTEANENLSKAAQTGDYTQMANAMNTVNALSGHAEKMVTPDELKGRAQETQVKAQQSSTLKGIFDKVGSGKPLTDNEQAIYNAAWGIPPEKQVFQAYFDEVGPGKKFATRFDAARQYLEDQSSFKNAYRPDTMTEMEERAMGMYLTEKLGRAPSPGELGEALLKYRFGGGIEGMGDFKPGAEGKIPVAQSRQAVSRAIEAIIAKNPDYKQFALPSGSAAGGVTYGFRPNYKQDESWYEKTFGDQGAIDSQHDKFMDEVTTYLGGQGYSTDQIRQMVGAVRFGMDDKPQPGQPQTNNTPSTRDLQRPSAYIVPGQKPAGLRQQGNIDIMNRPNVYNPETGGYSSVWSMSIGTDKGEVLIPRVSDDGRILSKQESIDLYRKTGKNLGIFDNPADATAYAKRLHEQQSSMGKKQYRVTKGGKSTTRSLSQGEVDALRGTPGFDVQPL